MIGFIQLHRKLMEWEWYTDQKTFKVFLHCLLKANFKDKQWRGSTIKRGQFVTSISHLASETGLTVKQVRTALDNLESTGEVGKQSTSLNTCITVIYYDKYQSEGKPMEQPKGKQKTNEGQQLNNVNKENKEDNNNAKAFKSESDFLEFFNKGVEKLFKRKGLFRTLTKTDLNNLKRLNTVYTAVEFKQAMVMMSKNDWVKSTNNYTPTHLLRDGNFTKYLNQTDVRPMAQGLIEGN